MHSKIALVKTGWSEDYEGGPVFGRYAHLQQYNEAHEKFNFLRHTDGRFYGYLPPIGAMSRPPQPKTKNGWLLIFVSAKEGSGPLTVVGWYKNATFLDDYARRPEYASGTFERDVHGEEYSYCVTAASAHLIPVTARTTTIPGGRFKRTPVMYLRGNGESERWREDLARLAEKVVGRPMSHANSTPHLSFPDSKHRQQVEEAAIEVAKELFRRTHEIEDRQKDKRGYDLLVRHRKSGEELHVEVKGTSGSLMHFYMSRNEFHYMALHPQWRLLVVSDVLGKPKAKLLTAKEVGHLFKVEPFAWEGTAKP